MLGKIGKLGRTFPCNPLYPRVGLPFSFWDHSYIWFVCHFYGRVEG